MKKPVLFIWILTVSALLSVGKVYANAPSLEVEGYARETPPGAPMSAVYLSLHNLGEQKRLLAAVELPGNQEAEADLHTTEYREGISRMRPLKQVAIAAGERLQMAPGGVHLMIRGLRLRAGDSLPLRLVFTDGFSLEIQVPVVGRDKTGKDHHHHHG
ncbi:copper chaperone PCu(A)C [Microbulbifer epialgicus]|uniref:Copper chaperone PCu(A)C n=1 Tax=Microbulbifer epialgicus TaxID=393907 RepID=A0ABV4NYY3_9GAMM